MQKYKTVTEFLDSLTPEKRALINALRAIILEHPGLEEHIKWNAPSYIYIGEDRITFNTMNKEGAVKLVLHMGANKIEDKSGQPVMDDPSGLVQWSSDIRGVVTFQDLAEVTSSRDILRTMVHDWLSLRV